MKARADRPRPVANFFSNLFGPIFSFWSFIGMIPTLIYGAFVLVCVWLGICFLRLFFK